MAWVNGMIFAVGQKGELMSDLIDRQAAIDALDRMRIEYLQKGRDVLIMWECEDVLRQLPSAQPEQQWIPCSERLPDSRRCVLITVSNGKDYETCEAYYHKLRKDWFEVSGDRVCEMSPRWKTIAWCELPEPYKDGEDA